MARAEWLTMEQLTTEEISWCFECNLETNVRVTYFVSTPYKDYLDTIEWCENCTQVNAGDDDD